MERVKTVNLDLIERLELELREQTPEAKAAEADYLKFVERSLPGYNPETKSYEFDDVEDMPDGEAEAAELAEARTKEFAQVEKESRFRRLKRGLGSFATRMMEGRESREARRKNETFRKKLGRGAILAALGTGAAVATVAGLNEYAQAYMPEAHAQFTDFLAQSDFFSSGLETTSPVIQEVEIDPAVESYVIGGNGDPTSQGAKHALGDMGAHAIEYPASIAPAGDVTMQESISTALPEMFNVFGQAESNPSVDYEVSGYSLGSVVAAESANDYVEAGGEINGNVDINLYGTPLVENTGAFDSGSVEGIPDLLDAVGIVYDTELPEGADAHAFKNDFWANAGGDTPKTTQISQFAAFSVDGHAVPVEGVNAVLTGETEMSNGGVAHSYEHMHGEQHALVRAAEAHTPFVADYSPQTTEFIETIAPIGEVGSPDIPQIDTYAAVETGAAAIDEALAQNGFGPVHAEAFVDGVGVENVAPVVQPVVDYLNQPLDLSPLNSPVVADIITGVQDSGIDIQGHINHFIGQ